MTSHRFRRLLTCMLATCALAAASTAHAAGGYMAFLMNGPGGTPVTAGTAESYMRAGRDWTRLPADVVGGIAVPKLILTPIITTWKDVAGLHFKFVIDDRTPDKPNGTALSCGDQVIVQIGPANTAATALVQGQEFRYEVVIKGSAIPAGVKLRLPTPPGDPDPGTWKFAPESTTGATVTNATNVGSPYSFELVIPLGEIGNPAGDFGLAIALINDLGHSHGAAPGTNEASGTAFPVGMGLTPESDPGLNCGAQPSGETATGNWINPSTWGVGYTALSTTPNVTFDQGPAGWLSRAIRIGRCDVTDFNQITEATTANWVSDQTNLANNWYKFNSQNPCRMTIWMNVTVSSPGTTQRRFLAVWGRPGISPQAWYFAGMTAPVTVSSPNAMASFVWTKPTPVATGLGDHPCMRVYALPATLSVAQHAAVSALAADTTAAGGLAAFETAFASWASANPGWAAQMNFANYDNNSSCTEANCMPIASVIGPDRGLLARSLPFATVYAQPSQPQVAQPPVGDRPRPGDDRQGAVRIIAHAFGVADPQGNKPYMFVEDIGGLGWVVSNQVLAQTETIVLPMQVSNPAITEKMYVDGTPVEVRSPNRRILVTTVVDGTPAPRIDLSALNRFAETPLTPGQTFDSQITIIATGLGWNAWLIKWWWLILLLLLITAIVLYVIRRPATP